MKKYVLFADPHIGKQNHNNFWADTVLKLFDSIIDTCDRNNIKDVICLGDWFDSRKNLNVLTINLAEKICKQYFEDNDINLYIIRGNHDTFYKNQSKPHSLSFLKLFNNIHIVEEQPLYLDYFYLVPWGSDLSNIENDSFIMGHFEINGFITNYSGHTQTNSKLNISDFKRFNKVLSGHFHTPSKQGNIQYIGSSFAMDFNDINSDRGYYILDNHQLQFIEFKEASKFISISTEDNFDESLIYNNIIRLTFTKDYGNVKNQQIIDSIYELQPASLQTNYNIEDEDEEMTLEEDFDVNDNSVIMREYIERSETPDHLNKKVLKKLIEQLEEE